MDQVVRRHDPQSYTSMASGKTAIEALQLMQDGRYRHVKEGKVVGIVSRFDFSGLELDRTTKSSPVRRSWSIVNTPHQDAWDYLAGQGVKSHLLPQPAAASQDLTLNSPGQNTRRDRRIGRPLEPVFQNQDQHNR